MLKEDYETKMKALLNTTTFKKTGNLTSRIQDCVNKLVLKWYKNEKSDTNIKNSLKCYNYHAPNISQTF